jgi:hypothetical protein
VGPDGKAEVFSGSGSIEIASGCDVDVPVKEIQGFVHARFTADLPYGKVLKTYQPSDFK